MPPNPLYLTTDGDGGLHLPEPYPALVIRKEVMSRASPFLADLYTISNHVFVSKTDDPEAVCVLAKMFHGVDIVLEQDCITLESILRMANLMIKWKCSMILGNHHTLLWVDKLQQFDDRSYEPWNTWLSIGRAFGRPDIVGAVLEKHAVEVWRSAGHAELEDLQDLVDKSTVGEYNISIIPCRHK